MMNPIFKNVRIKDICRILTYVGKYNFTRPNGQLIVAQTDFLFIIQNY